MKIVTVIGARPQFIKAAPVSKFLRDTGHREYLVHTGQHYDYGMSQVFFEELGLPEANINLNVGSGSHGIQTGQMLIGIEEVLLMEKPDWVLVYGDTNSTLSGALAAVKLHIPLAHVEAGLRSFNREMPEEHNRVLTDHCADLLFCPTQTAIDNLAREGLVKNAYLVGDTMYDAVKQFSDIARGRSQVLFVFNLEPKKYALATIHRASNTDRVENVKNILFALNRVNIPVVLALHPRTRSVIEQMNLSLSNYSNIIVIPPQGYLDMLMLEQNAYVIMTDSGGMQKEAYWMDVPCITLREETEWMETLQHGRNILAGANSEKILEAFHTIDQRKTDPVQFTQPESAFHIMQILEAL